MEKGHCCPLPFKPTNHVQRRTGLNGMELPKTLRWAFFPPSFVTWICQIGCYCLFCRRTPTGSNNAPPMRRDLHKLWQKSHLYHKNDTFSYKHSRKFWDAGKESGKYHLLLMLLRTFEASLASAALRHCITIRWAECWQCNWWNFTENRFRLWTSRYSWSKSIIPGFNRSGRFPQCVYASGGRGLTFLGGFLLYLFRHPPKNAL